MKTLIGFAVLLTAVTFATAAWAGGGPTGDTACGSAPAGWNAPNGAVVFNRSNGPIRAIIDKIGESRTHTMISHGPGGWVTHATMHSPGTNDVCEACDNPVRRAEIEDATASGVFPGASQVKQGGIYTFLYSGGGQEYVYYQRGNRSGSNDQGATIADWLWSSMPYTSATSQQDSGQGFYRLLWDDGTYIKYGFNSFRDMKGAQNGQKAWDNGIHCSGLAAYGQSKALGSTYNVSTSTYDTTKSWSALDGLRAAVESDCNNSVGFWKGLAVGFACFFCDLDTNICDDAGRQVGYCFYGGNGWCHKGGDDWLGGNPGVEAVSISPDRIGGWGHPYSGSGSPNTGISVWAYDNNQTIQWNSGGNQYSCWF